jgi:hypothetical protein
MSVERRRDAIAQVVVLTDTDLSQRGCDASWQQCARASLRSLDEETAHSDHYHRLVKAERTGIADAALETHLDHLYTMVTSTAFYADVSPRCKSLCVSNLAHPMFERHTSYKPRVG